MEAVGLIEKIIATAQAHLAGTSHIVNAHIWLTNDQHSSGNLRVIDADPEGKIKLIIRSA